MSALRSEVPPLLFAASRALMSLWCCCWSCWSSRCISCTPCACKTVNNMQTSSISQETLRPGGCTHKIDREWSISIRMYGCCSRKGRLELTNKCGVPRRQQAAALSAKASSPAVLQRLFLSSLQTSHGATNIAPAHHQIAQTQLQCSHPHPWRRWYTDAWAGVASSHP